ncbi:hypothetical protein [uncultured Sphingomonas sp.]|uniref:hypothetical protein n=1 Tax=uncultured Sphingomonas sp. TaxID=158754 RepID=UPI0035C9CCD7
MRSTRPILAAVAILAAAAPALADVVVIRASGPSAPRYAAGKSLPDGARIVLQRGDQIVLLDAHGTRTVSGPGTFPAVGSATAAGSSLITLASNTADRRNRVGAVRNLPTGTPAVRPNIFLVDVAAAGNVCVVDPRSVTLWRGAADAAGSSTIVGADGSTATVAWIKGQTTQPWPTTLPVAADRSYRVTQAGSAKAAPVPIAFQLMAAPPTDLPELAKGLIAHGCQAQVDVMIATTGAAAS